MQLQYHCSSSSPCDYNYQRATLCIFNITPSYTIPTCLAKLYYAQNTPHQYKSCITTSPVLLPYKCMYSIYLHSTIVSHLSPPSSHLTSSLLMLTRWIFKWSRVRCDGLYSMILSYDIWSYTLMQHALSFGVQHHHRYEVDWVATVGTVYVKDHWWIYTF